MKYSVSENLAVAFIQSSRVGGNIIHDFIFYFLLGVGAISENFKFGVINLVLFNKKH